MRPKWSHLGHKCHQNGVICGYTSQPLVGWCETHIKPQFEAYNHTKTPVLGSKEAKNLDFRLIWSPNDTKMVIFKLK